jgi:DNA polymerase III epsilon subunit family exonuclease
MAQLIDDIKFVIFDVETTGLRPQGGDRICEIAAIKTQGTKRLDEFHSLINPQRPVSLAAFQVNRIDDELLRGAPLAGKVLPEFLHFSRGCWLAAYNAGFDISFLEEEFRFYLDLPFSLPAPVIDILSMARSLLPGLQSYALASVAETLGISVNDLHRAPLDADVTCSIFERFLRMLNERGIRDAQHLEGLFGLRTQSIESQENQKVFSILQAIDLRACLQIKYFSPRNGKVSQRQVRPIQIQEENQRRYLVAFCQLRGEKRTFRVDKILELEICP